MDPRGDTFPDVRGQHKTTPMTATFEAASSIRSPARFRDASVSWIPGAAAGSAQYETKPKGFLVAGATLSAGARAAYQQSVHERCEDMPEAEIEEKRRHEGGAPCCVSIPTSA